MPEGMFIHGGKRKRNPLTADVVYSDEELIWLKAVDRWRRAHDGRTPNFREVLSIARSLGYEKETQSSVSDSPPALVPAAFHVAADTSKATIRTDPSAVATGSAPWLDPNPN